MAPADAPRHGAGLCSFYGHRSCLTSVCVADSSSLIRCSASLVRAAQRVAPSPRRPMAGRSRLRRCTALMSPGTGCARSSSFTSLRTAPQPASPAAAGRCRGTAGGARALSRGAPYGVGRRGRVGDRRSEVRRRPGGARPGDMNGAGCPPPPARSGRHTWNPEVTGSDQTIPSIFRFAAVSTPPPAKSSKARSATRMMWPAMNSAPSRAPSSGCLRQHSHSSTAHPGKS